MEPGDPELILGPQLPKLGLRVGAQAPFWVSLLSCREVSSRWVVVFVRGSVAERSKALD